MSSAVGPAVGCLMATFGTSLITNCIFDFEDPEEVASYSQQQRLELWGLQVCWLKVVSCCGGSANTRALAVELVRVSNLNNAFVPVVPSLFCGNTELLQEHKVCTASVSMHGMDWNESFGHVLRHVCPLLSCQAVLDSGCWMLVHSHVRLTSYDCCPHRSHTALSDQPCPLKMWTYRSWQSRKLLHPTVIGPVLIGSMCLSASCMHCATLL